MKSFVPVLPILHMICLFLPPGVGAEEVPRTFTNQAGVKIEAILVGILGDGKIKIRRTSDAREFELPIASLSQEDQRYLAELRGQSGAPEESSGVKISVADPLDRVRLGYDSAIDFSGSHRYNFPKGVWLEYSSSTGFNTFTFLYKGERTLEFSVEDGWKFLVSRDGTAPEWVGAILSGKNEPPDAISTRIGEINDSTAIKDSIHLSIGAATDLDQLSAISAEVPISLSLTTPISKGTADLLAGKNLIALDARNIPGISEWLSGFQRLVFLELRFEAGVSGNESALPLIPSLRQLELYGPVLPPGLSELLGKLGNLETFVMLGGADGSSTSGNDAIRSFGANPRLSLLSLFGGGLKITPEALGTLPNLEYLNSGALAGFESDSDYKEFLKLQNLRYLDLSSSGFPARVLDNWAESGDLKELRVLSSTHVPPLQHFPALEYLAVNDMNEQDTRKGPGISLENAPATLTQLFLWSKEHVKLRDLPNPGNLLYLQLSGPSLEPIETLERHSNLTVLSLASFEEKGIKSIDAAAFPKLRSLTVQSLPELVGIENVAAHPSLAELVVSNTQKLESLGTSAPNRRLFRIQLNGLDNLRNLDAFAQTYSCRDLSINRCNGLNDLNDFVKRNPLRQFTIRDCANFPDQTERR